MHGKTIILGWTGGIGMGKSTSADFLRRRNIPVIDTDVIAREEVKIGKPAWGEIRAVFGSDVMAADDQIDRERLAEIVFADSAARQKLEAILHPRIRAVWRAKVDDWRRGDCHAAAVIIPLLFETQAKREFDAVACVACSAETQLDRLLARGWTREAIERRNHSQWPVESKIGQSDFVVWTEGVVENHDDQIGKILSQF